MNIKSNLKQFYDSQAKKYYETRQKHRSDGELLLQEIEKIESDSISILEFGCGSGRLITYLRQNLKNKKIKYVGVDLSQKLINYAQKDNLKDKFVCEDITQFIKQSKQETFDLIVGIASFQHIPTYKERTFLVKNFYRCLKYNGKLIMTNRSLSMRFIKKYKFTILHSIIKYIGSFTRYDRRNIYIPWKVGNNDIAYRFYHMFGLHELKILAHTGGFMISKLGYIDNNNTITQEAKNSKNSILVAFKGIYQ